MNNKRKSKTEEGLIDIFRRRLYKMRREENRRKLTASDHERQAVGEVSDESKVILSMMADLVIDKLIRCSLFSDST